MKQIIIALAAAVFLVSCGLTKPAAQNPEPAGENPGYAGNLITHSLYNDKASTISEEGIQKILAGNYKLPTQLRVAIVKLESAGPGRNYHYYWNDEEYLKTQQNYLDVFSEKIRQSLRVSKVSVIPDLLISKTPTFTAIREAAVRMQADIVVVYSITSDIYSKYKLLSKSDIKAYATTQAIVLDVKTGLIPFSAIVTKDYLSKRRKEELADAEARNRTQHEAVLLTIFDIGQKLSEFLKGK
jgi:hypothetical protein